MPKMQSRIRTRERVGIDRLETAPLRAASLLNASTRNTPEPQLGSMIRVGEPGAASPGLGQGRISFHIISASGNGV